MSQRHLDSQLNPRAYAIFSRLVNSSTVDHCFVGPALFEDVTEDLWNIFERANLNMNTIMNVKHGVKLDSLKKRMLAEKMNVVLSSKLAFDLLQVKTDPVGVMFLNFENWEDCQPAVFSLVDQVGVDLMQVLIIYFTVFPPQTDDL